MSGLGLRVQGRYLWWTTSGVQVGDGGVLQVTVCLEIVVSGDVLDREPVGTYLLRENLDPI